METTNNIKKTSSFPIACILFLLGFVLFLIYSILNNSTIKFENAAASVGILSQFIMSLPFLLMAFSSANTTKKPSILFLIVLFVQGLLSSLSIVGTVIGCIYNFQRNLIYGIVNIIPAIAMIILTLGYFCVFIYSLIAKILKKPSKLFKVWFLFPSVSIVGYITAISGRIVTLIVNFVDAYGFSKYHIMSLASSFFFALSYIVFAGAFFAVCYQFAKVNKNLPVSEEKVYDEVSETTE